MKVTICDKCKAEIIGTPEYVMGKELCDNCANELDTIIEHWSDGKQYNYSRQEWHDQRLGFPRTKGIYLLTLEFPDGAKCIRTGKYIGFAYWYKTAKALTPIEQIGAKVTAWAELPLPYKAESEEKE